MSTRLPLVHFFLASVVAVLCVGCGGSGGGGQAPPPFDLEALKAGWRPGVFMSDDPSQVLGVRLDGDPPADTVLEYRAVGAVDWTSVTSEPEGYWMLTGLLPEVDYEYRLSSASLAPQVFPASTAPTATTSFSFAAYGDSRNGHEIHRDIQDRILDLDVDLVFHLGDIVSNGLDPEEWDDYLARLLPLDSQVPLVTVMGNHEASGSMFLDHLGTGTPPQQRWFTFDYGCMRFIGLSTEDSAGTSQTAFLQAALAGRPPAIEWTVVAFHAPFFGPYVRSRDASYEAQWRPEFEAGGVDLVLWGHDHLYGRRELNGVTYIITGGGGAPLHAVDEDLAVDWTVAQSTFEYLYVTVSQNRFACAAITATGTIFDAFEFTK